MKIKELGITQGCGDGNFCPESRVTYGEMATFAIRARMVKELGYVGTMECTSWPGSTIQQYRCQSYFYDAVPSEFYYPFAQKAYELMGDDRYQNAVFSLNSDLW